MKYVRYLKLIVTSGGSVNLLEGNQWELFLSQYLTYLSQFHFHFQFIPIDRQYYNEINVLNTFRTTFWINRDYPWYVGYNINDLILYTIPYFVPRKLKHSLDSTTIPLEKYSIYNDQINEVNFDSNYKFLFRYMNIHRVILSSIFFDENLLDLSKVEYLCVKSSEFSLRKLFEIIRRSMICLYHLDIQYNLSTMILRNIRPFEQIRILNLYNCSESIISDLSSVFPLIEYLTIRINSINQIIQIIDRFRYLSSVSFYLTDSIDQIFNESNTIYQWLKEKSKRLSQDNNFICRLNKIPNISIDLWMNNEIIPSKKSSNIELMNIHKNKANTRCGCLLQ